ncbi:uncharacterized protein BT62DRAFT_1077315 [Guyanagaster necrorhizus]|uniref:C2H2-type domain-containing protein n=1 Tax=Guyanagaster necrorhizus TaxID=856835 RepID=A0A9P7VQT5_9AGAR|nr:uncharacterized protein BT62DRAFT_1077315 [Guyanagaster necrorhizus MCA 3950]KAG7445112.1 hypothetical protein BT62DRAFT_1077315 [Guyanagaster necrorhizus MCA 3950]
MSLKRPRTSVSPTVSPSSSPEPEPAPKALHTAGASHPLLCTLPPTCNHNPTSIANSKDLETHYATYHAHVCEEKACSCVFPEARLLELHQTECHDPLAAIRKDRGDKIFACHLTTCPKLFLTPKARRLHLINAHGYPKEYFFAVTNKGVGGLLKKWGEGASMIRGEWKKREGDGEDDDDDAESDAGTAEENETEEPNQDLHAEEKSEDLDALADSMTSLSLVPNSIRFGRGGKGGGLLHTQSAGSDLTDGQTRIRGRGGRRGKRAMARYAPGGGQEDGANMDVDLTTSGPASRHRGFPRGINRGFVPRARARGAVPVHAVPRGGPGIIVRGRGGGSGFV